MQSDEADVSPPRVEWPTVALAVLIYAAWLALTYFYQSVPLILLPAFGGLLLAWHGSLQHEVMHGHPTRIKAVNTAVGFPPLSLWLPYLRYRQTHLRHHLDERLTDPLDDPESNYWTPEQWAGLGTFGRGLVRAQATLLGRMLIGPLWSVTRFWRFDIEGLIQGREGLRRIWAQHLAGVAVVLWWVSGVCGMPLWLYILAFVYPGAALSLVRSFAEHKADSAVERRTAIVERSWFFGVLFLFNNLHAAHHMRPTIAWYRLPRWYAAHRATLVERNGGLVYSGYADVFRRFFLTAYQQAVHPVAPRAEPPAEAARQTAV